MQVLSGQMLCPDGVGTSRRLCHFWGNAESDERVLALQNKARPKPPSVWQSLKSAPFSLIGCYASFCSSHCSSHSDLLSEATHGWVGLLQNRWQRVPIQSRVEEVYMEALLQLCLQRPHYMFQRKYEFGSLKNNIIVPFFFLLSSGWGMRYKKCDISAEMSCSN